MARVAGETSSTFSFAASVIRNGFLEDVIRSLDEFILYGLSRSNSGRG
jgi:hypothetical protein